MFDHLCRIFTYFFHCVFLYFNIISLFLYEVYFIIHKILLLFYKNAFHLACQYNAVDIVNALLQSNLIDINIFMEI